MSDPGRLALAAINLLGTLGPGHDQDVIALMTEAAAGLESLAATPERLSRLAELLARHSAYVVHADAATSRRLAEEALLIARQAGDSRTPALALMYSTKTNALERSDLRNRLREAALLAEADRDHELLLAANSNLMAAALTWADRDQFDRHLAEYARIAATMGAPGPTLLSAIDHAGATALDGHYDDADGQLDVALRRAELLHDPSLVNNIWSTKTVVDRELGRLARHEQRIRAGGWRTVDTNVYLAHVLSQSGDLEHAAQHFASAMADPEELLAGSFRRLHLTLLAEATAHLPDRDASSLLLRWMQPELRYGSCVIIGPNTFFGAASRTLGLLSLTIGDAASAVEHHAAALVVHGDLRAAGWVARSKYDLGAALRARGKRGDGEQATRLLAEASRAAWHLGMPKLTTEIDALDGV